MVQTQRLLISAIAFFCFHQAQAQSQSIEPIYFEHSPMYIPYYWNYSRVLLQTGSSIGRDNLIEIYCIPSFTPPWAVQMYHPEVGYIHESGLQAWKRDTLHYVVRVAQATKVPTGEMLIKDPYLRTAKKSLPRIKTREIPPSYAQEVIKAFAATLSHAHWPSGRDLLSVDGTHYHFGAYDRYTDTHMWAQSISPGAETRTQKLVALSNRLIKFVQADTDSLADQALKEIHSESLELSK